MPELTITTGVLVTLVSSGIGGVVGGYLAGYEARLLGSVLVGIIGGTALAVVLEALEVSPLMGVEGYSIVFAFLGGGLTAFIVGSVS